jgi:drug/metabolite transporter (DMT)-like permease
MKTRIDARLLMAVAVTAFFAASVYSGIGAGLEAYDPGPLSLLRLLSASAALAVYALLSRRVRLPAVRDLPAAALSGLMGFAAYNVALAYGQDTVSAGTAGLLHASIPVFTALLAVAFLGERLGGLAWAGIAVSFSGVVLISLSEGGGLRFDTGAFLVLLSAVSASLYFVVQKPYLEKYSALEFTSCSIWAGTLILAPFLPGLVVQAQAAPPEATLSVVYVGVFATAVAYATLAYVFSRLPAARAGVVNYLIPPLALAIAWVWLGEVPTLIAVLGGVVTLIGVALVNARGESQSSSDT